MYYTNEGWFINLTNTIIPKEISGLLQLGESFSLPDSFDRKNSIMEFIKDIETYTKIHKFECQLRIRNMVIPELHNILRGKRSNDPIQEKLWSMMKSTISFRHKHLDIFFTKADKESIIIASDRHVYNNKIMALLNDKDTYMLVDKDSSPIIKRKLNEIFKKWLSKDYINKKVFYIKNK